MGICMSGGEDGGSCNGSKIGSIESGGGALEKKMVAEVTEMMKVVEMHAEAEAQMYTRV